MFAKWSKIAESIREIIPLLLKYVFTSFILVGIL